MLNIIPPDIVEKFLSKKRKQKIQPRPPEIMKKGGAHKDKTKYSRRKKHAKQGQDST